MEVKRSLRNRVIAIMLICAVGLTMTFSVNTDEAAAASKPSGVSISSVKSIDHNAVKVTWEKAKNAKKYQVYRATSKSGKYKKIKTTTAISYTNKKLTTGKRYYYKVRAINGSKKGKFSKVKSGVPKLKQVTGVKAAGVSERSIKLSWDKVNGAKGYQVYRASSENGTYKKIGTTASTAFTNKNLPTNIKYYYKVRAYKVVKKKEKYGPFSAKIVMSATKPISAAEMSEIRTQMLAAVNEERKKAGAAPLELDDAINETSQIKAEDMYKTGVFSHHSSNLGYFYDQFAQAGISYYVAGENIAHGQSSVNDVMNSWMNSSGHKANILNKDYTHLGVGYFNGYWVQQFAGINETMDCPKCGNDIYISTPHYTSKDAEGNLYNIYQCSRCYYLLEKCPKCENGYFKEAGITNNGSIAKKCDICGNHQNSSCIENCPSCNEKVLGNHAGVAYKITADTTKTYDGKTYTKQEGCYFQQFVISLDVCKTCGKFVRPDAGTTYNEVCAKLAEKVGTENIYDYITWEKEIGTELIESSDSGASYRIIYEFIDTPEIEDISDIVGNSEY